CSSAPIVGRVERPAEAGGVLFVLDEDQARSRVLVPRQFASLFPWLHGPQPDPPAFQLAVLRSKAPPERFFLVFAQDKFPSSVFGAPLSDQHILVLATEVIAQGPIIHPQLLVALLEVVEVAELLFAYKSAYGHETVAVANNLPEEVFAVK